MHEYIKLTTDAIIEFDYAPKKYRKNEAFKIIPKSQNLYSSI